MQEKRINLEKVPWGFGTIELKKPEAKIRV